MQSGLHPDPVSLLKTPLQCPACGGKSIIVMQLKTFFDRLAWAAWCAPLLCRICHVKFYRKVRKELEQIARTGTD
jgi:transcription elongation factor Elf1